MKRLWVVFLFLWVSAAHATDSYSEEVCVTRIGGERVSFFRSQDEANFIIQGQNEDFDLRAAYSHLKSGAKPLGGEDLLLSITRQHSRTKMKFKDECYRGHKGSFRRELQVERVSRRARDVLKLQKGQIIQTKCVWEALVPRNGCPPSMPEEPTETEN